MCNHLNRLKKIIELNKININLQLIEDCYDFVKKNLGDGKRITGETYLEHSCKAAIIAAEINADPQSIICSLLHETAFLKPETLPEISQKFGKDIGQILKKFNKLGAIKFTPNRRLRENIKKMIFGISDDIRVVIVKLTTVLETLEACQKIPKDQRIEIAKQGMLIYAPIADLLGIWSLRMKIEDIAFEILNPKEYNNIFKNFRIKKKKEQQKYIKQTKDILLEQCQQRYIDCEIDGRYKHIYSIYKKMKNKKKKFNEIYDVFALRVICNEIHECYQILGIIHSLWKPFSLRIKDYIAQPKPNGYQSLHTTVFANGGLAMEFQIRTLEMHETAEYGLAAHWKYKNENGSIMENTRWVNDILKLKKRFFENKDGLKISSQNKLDIFKTRIFVYTPHGDVIDLPENATPIDFAYYIHSEIGRKCYKAIVNNQPAKLYQPLKNNDVVEIILDKTQKYPNEKWLKYTVSSHAKRKIKNQLNKD